MLKRIVSLSLIICFLMTQPAFLLAQLPDSAEEIASELRIITKEKIVPEEEGYERLTCPFCSRDFEIKVDPNDIEFKKGIKKIACPYDGKEFYPTLEEGKTRELQYETVRCLHCGREFRGYVDVKGLLSGRSQMLTCPYDKKRFYFKAEGYRPAALALANVQTVICPTDKRTFKAYIDLEEAKELTCPYDGTKFFPTAESIIFDPAEAMVVSGMPGGGLPPYIGGPQPGFGIGGTPQTTMVPQVTGIPGRLTSEEKPSRIEEIFSEHIPLNVSTAIRQFGYEIFRSVKKVDSQRGEEKDTKTTQDEKKLLKTLFGAKREEEIFGEGRREEGMSVFITPTEIPVISDYVLGPGDVLQISIWGQIQEVFPITIDAEGKVLLPKVGPLYLWGLKFGEAEQLIKNAMLKAYTNIQISVSLGRLRGIKIFVLGEAQVSGAYTISALSNSFHALYAAGGPTKLGTMRKMKLLRKGSGEMPIDLYNLLIKGDNSQDYKLQDNDTIFIPPIGDVVGVAGNVKRPAIYELNEKIKLSDVIEMAGGLSSIGYLQRIQLERVQDHLRKVVLDLEFKSLPDLKNSPNNIELRDGDLVLVFPITAVRYNFVSISGNVLRPGDYELKTGMRLKDLIDKAGGILPGTYLKRAEVARFKSDQTREIVSVSLLDLIEEVENANLTLKEWDVVTIYPKKELTPQLFVEIDGAVNKPGRYELTENMKLSDLIFKGGGLKRNASLSNVELFRSFLDTGPKVVNIDLNNVPGEAGEGQNKDDLLLEGGDHLFVREAILKEEKFIITLSGEFMYPGKYAVEKGTRFSEVVERAGGFTEGAFLDGAIYTRESTRVTQQKVIQEFVNSEQNAMLQEQASLAIGATATQVEARNKIFEYRKKLAQRFGELHAPGRILIRLSRDLQRFKGSEYDIIVEDKDILHIPTYPYTVNVIGNVYGPGTVTYSEKKGVDYYINRVGGLTRAADANRIFVIRANGETLSNFVRAVKVRQGDTIIVPEEFKYRTLPGILFKDLAQVLYQISLGAIVTITALNTL